MACASDFGRISSTYKIMPTTTITNISRSINSFDVNLTRCDTVVLVVVLELLIADEEKFRLKSNNQGGHPLIICYMYMLSPPVEGNCLWIGASISSLTSPSFAHICANLIYILFTPNGPP